MASSQHLTRQRSLDFTQSKSAMQILEKYCRKRYRASTVFISADSDYGGLESFDFQTPDTEVASPAWPTKETTPLSPESFDQRQSFFFGHLDDASKPVSPTGLADILGPNIQEEIRQKPHEKLQKYFWRVIKVLYNRFGLQHVLVVLTLVIYAFLGGAMFFYFEAPEEIRRHERLLSLINQRHNQLVDCYCTDTCESWLKDFKTFGNHTNHKLADKSVENCKDTLQSILLVYDKAAGYDPLVHKRLWAFNDYWNAVFYAWSLLTTIGYGNLSCRTIGGRVCTIIYSVIGIPLMLVTLNSLGKLLFNTVQHVWERVRIKLKRKSKTGYTDDKEYGSSEDSDDDNFATFPIKMALGMMFVYISICSVFLSLLEEWDFFTAFYFVFISVTTIGLGDVVPDNAHYLSTSFTFFIIGLSLVSMCYSIMQTRVENQYMSAFQLIDEEYGNSLYVGGNNDAKPTQFAQTPGAEEIHAPDLPFVELTPPPVVTVSKEPEEEDEVPPVQPKVLWRRRMLIQTHASTGDRPLSTPAVEIPKPNLDTESINRSPSYRVPSVSTLSGSVNSMSHTPPVLSALLSRRQTTRRLKHHPRLLRLHSNTSDDDFDNQQPRSSAINRQSTPNTSESFAKNATFHAPLSVITEAVDEETKEQLQRRQSLLYRLTH